MDFALYWFMFPVSIVVATTAMLSGIGGAAMFTPIFLIIFPLLGPEYPFSNIAAVIGVALLTETFGFSSGFIGYFRKGLIDFRSAIPFIVVGVPIAIVGALMLTLLKEFEDALRGAYALLMLVMPYKLIRLHNPAAAASSASCAAADTRPEREIIATDGTRYRFRRPRQGRGALATGTGGFLTGLLGVGIGECVMPQLAKRNGVPLPVAAATSVFIVIVVVASASFTQISALIAQGGIGAVPWNAVIYTVPAVIIGGQIGPRLHGKISPRTMEIAIGGLFVVIGVAMAWIVAVKFI